MLNKWDELEAMSRDQSSALEEARDLLNFKQLVERVMRWIKVSYFYVIIYFPYFESLNLNC